MSDLPRDAVGTALAGVAVLDPQGQAVRLGDLWRERAAVLVFLRHYG